VVEGVDQRGVVPQLAALPHLLSRQFFALLPPILLGLPRTKRTNKEAAARELLVAAPKRAVMRSARVPLPNGPGPYSTTDSSVSSFNDSSLFRRGD
jgi:hypothetical protein